MNLPANTGAKVRVAVIYDGFPHYRKGVIEELAASDKCTYFFFGDADYRDASIKSYDFKSEHNVVRTRSLSVGPFYLQWNILNNLIRNRISHCIFLGNPRFLSYWVLTPILRSMGKTVHFWSHGWVAREEPRMTRYFKDLFFRLPNGLLLYGCRAREIGLSRGFSPDRVHVVNNSLDYPFQRRLFESLAEISRTALRQELQLPVAAKIVICTARVTEKCRFDLLIQAASKLRSQSLDLYVLIVGDGPEREALGALAASLGVAHRFWGACYEEATIAKLYKASDLTVSPGKVGLTAIHSMAYGTPVISHDNFDRQMPECAAIVPGITGDFFAENSVDALAEAIGKWFRRHSSKPERACICRIEAEFTPVFQRKAIERALLRPTVMGS
jgi:glycosyltransferase involved in cell wall biosynthesis